MKKGIYLALGAFVALLLASARPLSAAERPYTEGSVWAISMVRVGPGYAEKYLGNLSNVWRREMEQGLKDGLILSYKVVLCEAANPDDWHLLLMVEYKNYAALDDQRQKWDAISAKVVGDEAAQLKGTETRAVIREIYGVKLGQELKFR